MSKCPSRSSRPDQLARTRDRRQWRVEAARKQKAGGANSPTTRAFLAWPGPYHLPAFSSPRSRPRPPISSTRTPRLGTWRRWRLIRGAGATGRCPRRDPRDWLLQPGHTARLRSGRSVGCDRGKALRRDRGGGLGDDGESEREGDKGGGW